ncbi:hypothetical protein CDG77_27110 [Nostoc sp. 'Peltigera membranacea cyanobiont' 213]|uniref:formylglycine-generating enzyme family protein n=1 Tax=Nostoc sp. 'Peltigera membranacea cyanobiont' 213 TaxID=2014530 RepID=UPI000B952703|nr:formylglycine-generating enzyme family protein [Nostoc sp. 'Peltigera membranacea cyanobiont' 213]OYD87859.1 hypothetical protein CDG77_27110 [Nostoc sp. 'Peltigera membranacea cyanobiont' 213]
MKQPRQQSLNIEPPNLRRRLLIFSGLGLMSAIAGSCMRQSSSRISKPGKAPILQTFEFEVITVDSQGQIVNRRQGKNQFFAEDLGKGAILEMVTIPGGQFLMGSSPAQQRQMNGSSSEPQHSVSVASFYLGKFEVTQAQWQAVAGLPKVQYDLDPNLSRYPPEFSDIVPNQHPIDWVSWPEAVEFCQRLSRRTGRLYRLPSEAEWEYACRAGTTTLYHFGEIITPENVSKTANYNKLTPVGSFSANPFGLYDMHGNVIEWCADYWHRDYYNAPTDGTARETPEELSQFREYRVVRGWKTAYRSAAAPNNRIGFRVACSIS